MSQIPAGWFPDPQDPTQLRYWDGAQWTEHRTPANPMSGTAPASSGSNAATPPGSGVGGSAAPERSHTPSEHSAVQGVESKKGRGWKIAFAVLAVLFVIGKVAGGDEPSSDSNKAAAQVETGGGTSASNADDGGAAEEVTEPENPYGPQPADQLKFLKATQVAQEAAANADNDLQRGAALSKRNEALCSVVGSGQVSDWAGEVALLDANGEGKGILTIEMADSVGAATWNNFLSDSSDHTLIEPGPLFDKVLALEEGQLVKFSGQFLDESGGPCVNDSRLTLDGKLSDPEFIFRFSDVKPVS